MHQKWSLLLLFALVALSACATVPLGPSVRVLPGPWKPFEVFQADDAACRQWAAQQTGISPDEAVGGTLAGGAAIGTLLGAGLGAAIGSTSGNAGAGAAIGAASGLLAGTAIATDPAYAAGYAAQRRYDNAYLQCMYAKGNQIPGAVHPSGRQAYPPPPPPPDFTPGAPVPPRAGPYPPPPPPDAR
jgi:predicted lipid-binding transport protein (Tim44 family)